MGLRFYVSTEPFELNSSNTEMGYHNIASDLYLWNSNKEAVLERSLSEFPISVSEVNALVLEITMQLLPVKSL